MKKKFLLFDILTLFAFALGACSNSVEQSTSFYEDHSSTISYSSTSSSKHIHTLKDRTVAVKDPTCTEYGSSVVITYCSECNAELSRQVITLPALGHDFISYLDNDSQIGLYICRRCGYSKPNNDYSSVAPIPRSSEPQYTSSEVSSEEPSSRRRRSSSNFDSEYDNLPEFEVKIDKKDGSDPVVTSIKQGQPIERPENPVAPAGKMFYGWMNTNNGNQIWSFEEDIHGDGNDLKTLNAVYEDVALEPLFIDNSLVESRVEAELAPIITEANDGEGLDGATYSGGQKGRGLIYKAYDGDFNIEPMYVNDPVEDDDDFETIARYATDEDPEENKYGAFLHFLYMQGIKLTYVIECSEAIENAVMFMKIASEYGNDDDLNDVKSTFTDQMVPIKVNGTALQYGTVTVHGIVQKYIMPFQDYLVSTAVNLQQGTNTIEIEVANDVCIFGTLAATAPMIDCLKIYAPGPITCTNACMDNLSEPF